MAVINFQPLKGFCSIDLKLFFIGFKIKYLSVT